MAVIRVRRALRLATGAAAGLGVALATIAITASASGLHVTQGGSAQLSVTPVPAVPAAAVPAAMQAPFTIVPRPLAAARPARAPRKLGPG